MSLSILQVALISITTGAAGAAAGFLLAKFQSGKRSSSETAACLQQLEKITAERDALATSEHEMRSSVDAVQSESSDAQAELDEAREALQTCQTKLAQANRQKVILAKNFLVLRAERESTKSKVSSLQRMLVAVHQKTTSMQAEYQRVNTVYKQALGKASDRCKELEKQLSVARIELLSLRKRVEASSAGHDSTEGMVESARLRLGQIEVLERTVQKLENEKAQTEQTVRQLRQDSSVLKQENALLKQELVKIDELKIHNQQLIVAVEALERSRKEHEQEAEVSAQESDTLRMKLAEIEEGFAAIEMEQSQALRDVRDVSGASNSSPEEDSEMLAHLTG